MGTSPDNLRAVEDLVALSSVDLIYSDLYLHRARTLLSPLCEKSQYLGLTEDSRRLPALKGELQRAAEQGDWPSVRTAAAEAARLRDRLDRAEPVLKIAEVVYGTQGFEANALALGLTGVIPADESTLRRGRESLVGHLNRLIAVDAPWESLYRSRQHHFSSAGVGQHRTALEKSSEIRRLVLEAAAAGDYHRVLQLTPSSSVGAVDGRVVAADLVPAPVEAGLAAPIDTKVCERAESLGLAAECLEAADNLNAVIARGHTSAAVLPALLENLDFLVHYPLITSAGVRYLPWFGRETLLVESFAEEDADAMTDLTAALGLDRRRGLSRSRVEAVLRDRGPQICSDLGLDPATFRLACVPFDAYLRLAPLRGWGHSSIWTHFDGYQVTRDRKLLALVGGHARFGGSANLSSLPSSYDSDHLTARFAILRRQRLAVRDLVLEETLPLSTFAQAAAAPEKQNGTQRGVLRLTRRAAFA